MKTLEEPPAHVKFLLATTDPQKIPVTVLSRCLQFNLKQMPAVAITGHLAHILQAEGVSFDMPALSLIARSAAGSMRDALSLLDQAIAHGAGKVEEEQVRGMLGTVNQDILLAILEALQAGEAAALLQVATDMGVRSLSFSAALQELGILLTRLQVIQCVPTAVRRRRAGKGALARAGSGLHSRIGAIGLPDSVNVGRSELASAPDEYSGFVMTLLRLHTFRPSSVADVLGSVAPRRSAPATVVKSPPERLDSVVQAAPVSPPSSDRRVESVMVPAANPPAGGEGDWHQIVGALSLSGLARELAQNCELRKLEDGLCLLRLSPKQGHLQMKPNPERLQQAWLTI